MSCTSYYKLMGWDWVSLSTSMLTASWAPSSVFWESSFNECWQFLPLEKLLMMWVVKLMAKKVHLKVFCVFWGGNLTMQRRLRSGKKSGKLMSKSAAAVGNVLLKNWLKLKPIQKLTKELELLRTWNFFAVIFFSSSLSNHRRSKTAVICFTNIRNSNTNP